jgi:hypothetical protein
MRTKKEMKESPSTMFIYSNNTELLFDIRQLLTKILLATDSSVSASKQFAKIAYEEE